MTRPDAPPMTRAVVVRGIGFGLAIALGAVGVWLIVTGAMSPRRIEIGVLAGLWGLLLGAYTMFGARRQHLESGAFASQAELQRRSTGGLEPAKQAEARRAFEERLEHLLRTEISTSVNREVGDLRREVAQLRQELLEKVGGQLRLERIETTRLIGSDLEALHHEVRQLKSARETILVSHPLLEDTAAPVDPAGPGVIDAAESARAIEAQAATERQRAEKARREQAEQTKREMAAAELAARQRAEREWAEREQIARDEATARRAERERVERELVERERVEREQPPAATIGSSGDPFASLPRITPFTDFELDPIEPPAPVNSGSDNGHAAALSDDDVDYTGRRRAGAPDSADAGRHYRHSDQDAEDDQAGGRRRRRDADDSAGLDVLSQLRSRESAEY